MRAPTQLAIQTTVPTGFHARPVSELPVRDVATEFHHDASPFVAWGADAEVSHARHREVFEHVVDVGEAEAGRVEAEEELVRTYRGGLGG